MEDLRRDYNRLTNIERKKVCTTLPPQTKVEINSENESSSGEDDYVDDLPDFKQNVQKPKMRASVSAEAFGKFNKKEDFKARVIEKT